MPKIKKAIEADLSAVLSNNIVVRTYRNQMVISNLVPPKKSKSVKRKNANDQFRAANKWAKFILKQPGMKELYARGINSKLSNSHTVAVRDYYHAPEIHYINVQKYTGTKGDEIRIKATDDFEVVSLTVNVKSGKGKQLENGPAMRYGRKPAIWVYKVTVANPDVNGTVIKVTARDLPDNSVIKEEKIESKK